MAPRRTIFLPTIALAEAEAEGDRIKTFSLETDVPWAQVSFGHQLY